VDIRNYIGTLYQLVLGHVDFLTNFGNLFHQTIGNANTVNGQCLQRIHISRLVFQSHCCDIFRHCHEIFILGNKISFTTHQNNYTRSASVVGHGDNTSFSSFTIGAFRCDLCTFLAQEIYRSLEITVGFYQSVFAIHHTCAGHLTQFIYF